jgi:hypothetical protein
MKIRLVQSLLILWCLVGCTSVYRDARLDMPPNATDRLLLRMEEARKSESEARWIARMLAVGGDQKPEPEDVDRLEVAARDIHRRALAVRDAQEGVVPGGSREYARLEHASELLLDAVQMERVGEVQVAALLIDRVLGEVPPEQVTLGTPER